MPNRVATRAGERRNRITIQAVTGETVAKSGAKLPIFDDGKKFWAAVEELTGDELWRAQQVQPKVTHRVSLLYYSGLTTRHRILWDGRTLGIASVINPDGRKQLHVLMCMEQFTEAPDRGY